MGIVISKNLSSELLLFDIKNTIRDLIKNYEVWTNKKNVCDNLESLYYNKLIKYDSDLLSKIFEMIGYRTNKSFSKEKICEMIVNHYKKRIMLLRKICDSVDECGDMLFKAKNGNYCKNVNKYIEDLITCSTIPNSIWIDKDEYQKLLKKFKEQNKISSFNKWINSLDNHYYKSLKKIIKIINLIKEDIENNISAEEFNDLEYFTDSTLHEMKTLCEIYYLLIINYR